MNDEYLIATRRDMTIRIVSPREFIGRIVDQRRPLSLQRDVILVQDEYAPGFIFLCALGGMVVLAGFAAVLTYGFASFLSFM